MINFNKNKLINETLDKYYDTFSHTLDTSDFVPEKFNIKISKYIFKNMKKAFRVIDKEDRKYQKEFRKKQKEKEILKFGKKEGFFKRLFGKKKKPTDSNPQG